MLCGGRSSGVISARLLTVTLSELLVAGVNVFEAATASAACIRSNLAPRVRRVDQLRQFFASFAAYVVPTGESRRSQHGLCHALDVAAYQALNTGPHS